LLQRSDIPENTGWKQERLVLRREIRKSRPTIVAGAIRQFQFLE
jgi:hypothetical protein